MLNKFTSRMDILGRIEEKYSQAPRDWFQITHSDGAWEFNHEFLAIDSGSHELQKAILQNDYDEFCKEVMEYLS